MKAILLTGPPGAGKSPLGDFLEKELFFGQKLVHFDFGRMLRNLVQAAESISVSQASESQVPLNPAAFFSPQEILRIKESVECSTLFEEKDRELVRKIFQYFLKSRQVNPDWLLLLNGLPRHSGQVHWLEDLVEVGLVVNLDCSEEIALSRIRANLDGEREGRNDDHPEVIHRRYNLYRERTEPLLSYFRKNKIPVLTITVNQNTRPEQIAQQLAGYQEVAGYVKASSSLQ